MKIADYMVTEDWNIWIDYNKSMTVHKGWFVKPIELRYLPKHIKDNDSWKRYMDASEYVFCYCSIGILPLPRRIIISV